MEEEKEEGALGRGILTSYYLRSYLATACAGSAEPDKAERGIRAGGTMNSARRSSRPAVQDARQCALPELPDLRP